MNYKIAAITNSEIPKSSTPLYYTQKKFTYCKYLKLLGFQLKIKDKKLIGLLIKYNLLLGVYSNSNPVPVTEPSDWKWMKAMLVCE